MGRLSPTLRALRDYESRNVTFIEPDGSWPIIWQRARGTHVWDETGKRYLDLTAAFGVTAAGHANPRVVRAGQQQMNRLLHAMGDVHPHALKAELARELSRLTFERWTRGLKKRFRGKVIFGSSGFEAVEAALKTAFLATGRERVIAFEGAYHGVGYGALNATHRAHFRSPFRRQLREFADFVPFPTCGACDCLGYRDNCSMLPAIEACIRTSAAQHPPGAILVEPMQARGGIQIPQPGFMKLLRKLADELGALLIVDEIYTGFGRTGEWFACEHDRVVPDVICLGKALTGGFPLSACVGRADLMDAAWPETHGEAIHTSTFLGHPVGCAMALAQIAEIRARKLPQRAASLGRWFTRELTTLAERLNTHPTTSPNRNRFLARGIGLMAGLEIRHADGSPATTLAITAVKQLLHRGFIVLPEGEHGNVIGFTPPLTITQAELRRTLRELERVLGELSESRS